MEKKNIKRVIGLLFSMILVFTGMFFTYVRANTVTVSNEAQLRTAIENKESDIRLAGDITISNAIKIDSQDDYTVNIGGNGHKLVLGSVIENMFVINGSNKNVTFDNITLDGNNNGRILDIASSTVNINNSTVENATTQNFDELLENGVNKQRYQGGAIYADGATINLENTNFLNNHSKNDTPKQKAIENAPEISPHGGAIYIGSRTTLNILGGSFENNYSGSGSPNGEGGAIKAEGGAHININVTGTSRTTFNANHNHHSGHGEGGLQGGALEITNSTVDINNTDFIVKGGFDTGGAIKFEGSGATNNHNKITNSTFKLVGGDYPQTPQPITWFGVSGGAIVSEHSYLTVDTSVFTMENNPQLAFAGGHIDIVGGGEFNLLNSTLKGNAPDWMSWNEVWKYKSAKYGGAIAFENGASAKALIKDTEIKNYMVDHTGGTIAVGHRNTTGNGKSEYGYTTVDLTIEGTTIHNGQAYTFDNNSAGAGIYITEGSKVVITKSDKTVSEISQMLANYGGAIFNKGELTLDGGTKITGNRGEQMTGGLYNDGYANVHDAVFSGNYKLSKWNQGDIHTVAKEPREKSGANIYARKDVIIGTNAKFDGQDIRVIDKQSSVVLSGPRESVINVSFSEKEKVGDNTLWEKEFWEDTHLYVGYQVGRGLKTSDLTATYTPVGVSEYVATPEDAKNFHFVSLTTDANTIAPVNDHTSTAKWDYVFNPDMKTVVLGQRAKMVYHTNETEATIKDGVADNDPNGQKVDQLYTFYSSGNGEPKVSIDNKPAKELTVIEDEPTLTGYAFRSWNTEAVKNKGKYDVNGVEEKYNFDNLTFTQSWHKPDTTAEITTILSPATENTIHTYAIYNKLVNVKAKKVWSAINKKDVIFELYKSKQDGSSELLQEKTVQQDNSDWVSFDGVPALDEQRNKINYFVKEKGTDENTNTITIDGIEYDVSVNDVTNTVENKEEDTQYFEVKNKEIYKLSVIKKWIGTKEEGDQDNQTYKPNKANEIQFEVYKGEEKVGDAITLSQNDQWEKTISLPAVDEEGNDIRNQYTVKEVGENENKITFLNDNFNVSYEKENDNIFIKNEYVPETTPFTAYKKWSGGPEQKPTITFVLQQNGVDYQGEGATKTLVDGVTEVTWTNLPMKKSNGEKYVYTVKESRVENYEATYNDVGNTVTNTYAPSNIDIVVNKAWVGKAGTSATVYLKAGENRVGTAVLNTQENWTHTFTVPATDQDGNKIEYTVEEDNIQGYTTKITKDENVFTVTNTYNTKTQNITARKIWKNVPKDMTKPEITFVLQRNGQPFGDEKTLASGVETVTWENIDIEDENGTPYEFNVIEKEVPAGYEVSYQEDNSVENGFTVINTNNEKIVVEGIKTWTGVDGFNDKSNLRATIELRDDNSVIQTVNVDFTNKNYRFENLPKYKNGVLVNYTISENGLENGYLNIDDYRFRVSYGENISTEENKLVYNVENIYVPELINFTATKVWSGGPEQKPTITFVLQQDGVDYQGEDGSKNLENGTSMVSWENLPKKKADGTNHIYSVREEVVDGYVTTYNQDKNEVTNTYAPKNIDIVVNKTWVGKAGTSARVHLKAGENIVGTVVLNTQENWTHTFTVPATDKDGNKIEYTVEEDNIQGYTTNITKDENVFTVTNTYNPKVQSITARKIWKNVPKDMTKPEITFVLQRNGQPFGDEKTLSSGVETVTWENIDIEDENGTPYEFNVIEKEVPAGYEVSYQEDNSVENGFTVINTNIEKTVVKGNKTWTGVNTLTDKDRLTTTIELSDGNSVVARANVSFANGAYIFENLSKYKDGVLVEYRVKEKDEKNNYININQNMFKVSYSDNKSDEDNTRVYDIVNTYLPPLTPLEPATTKIEVIKTWDNEEVKAESIQAELLKDGIKTGQKITLNDDNKWKGSFENLPIYEFITNTDGTETYRLISYQVVEDGEKDGKISYGKNLFKVSYIVDTNKVTIQNVYMPPAIPLTPAKVKVNVEKHWTNPEHKAKEVTVELIKNGVPTGNKLILNEDTEFKGFFEVPNTDENGKKIQYSIREVGAENNKIIIDGNEYDVLISGSVKDGFVVTNTYIEPKEEPKQPPKEIEKPKKEKPTVDTGDNNNIVLISIVGVISLILVLILALLGRKKNGK